MQNKYARICTKLSMFVCICFYVHSHFTNGSTGDWGSFESEGLSSRFFGGEGRCLTASKIVPARNGRAPHHATSGLCTKHSGQRRKGKGSAHLRDPSNVAGPDFQVPANQLLKQLQYCVAVPRIREGNSSISIPLDSVPPAVLALHLPTKKNGTLPANPTEYFNTCLRANTLVLKTQRSEM